ncbi:hypothetical protein [Xanthobacter autotrophicus]|uniref:hypothetical protein n=1 Tax=Xanthobacter autotrophicus TaxID=280 RepID=UPI0024A66B87|nr:hypothetical protein [Xanthobacter autotrophicus]MDI4657652.1 hypothetical protein [Xanthobacter autotrophicus]
MVQDDHRHLGWSLGKAFKALSLLAANAGEFRDRLRWAIDELSTIPREGLPKHVCEQLKSIDSRTLEGYVPGSAPHHFTIVSQNIRKIRGKKRSQLADDIILVCMDICEACGAQLKGAQP